MLRFVLALWLCGCNFCANDNYFGFRIVEDARLALYYDEYDLAAQLVEPLEDAEEYGFTAVYKREFIGGVVVVNMTGSTRTLSAAITGDLWGEGNTTVTTIPRRTGYLILT